ncbi:MAG: transposase [Verrucomicrobiales bacterium]|nr:transposase [Verrucomicrobiales bacterium]
MPTPSTLGMFECHLLPPAESLDLIARDSGLMQRHSRKFSAAGFLLALLQSVTKGDTYHNHLVMHLGSFVRTSMTRQAIHQRFGPASSAFLLGVLHTVLAKRFPTVIRDLRGGLFGRVLIEDSVVISMAKSNAENFPNHGNGRCATAGCKCLLLVNLLNGMPLDFQLHAAREADQSLVFESVNGCRKGDLLIRDMGFICIASLREIGRR